MQSSAWTNNIETYLLRELDRLAKKYAGGAQLYRIRQNGVDLNTLILEKKPFVRAIAKDLKNQTYTIQPATTRRAILDKERTLFQFEISDMLLHGAFAEILRDRLEPIFSSQLYSYRNGFSNADAVQALSQYVRSQIEIQTETKSRSIYVLRRDVRSYTDTIPLAENSQMWNLLKASASPITDFEWGLLKSMVKPSVWNTEKSAVQAIEMGLPTGSAITTVLANLYLMPLDEVFAQFPDGFYARFGDDFVFAHADAREVLRADQLIEKTLMTLGLAVHPRKAKNISLTGSGSASTHPSFESAQAIDYLGLTVDFRGNIKIPQEKAHELRKDLSERIRRNYRLCNQSGMNANSEIPQALVHLVNESISPNGHFTHPRILDAWLTINDRSQLKDLDYWIALTIAEQLSSQVGPKAFRKFSYRDLREKYGLISLVHLIDRGQR